MRTSAPLREFGVTGRCGDCLVIASVAEGEAEMLCLLRPLPDLTQGEVNNVYIVRRGNVTPTLPQPLFVMRLSAGSRD